MKTLVGNILENPTLSKKRGRRKALRDTRVHYLFCLRTKVFLTAKVEKVDLLGIVEAEVCFHLAILVFCST